MKWPLAMRCTVGRTVAPHWGAWIEMLLVMGYSSFLLVAPHWGAWIEIGIPT